MNGQKERKNKRIGHKRWNPAFGIDRDDIHVKPKSVGVKIG
jgi:hypothetical protein